MLQLLALPLETMSDRALAGSNRDLGEFTVVVDMRRKLLAELMGAALLLAGHGGTPRRRQPGDDRARRSARVPVAALKRCSTNLGAGCLARACDSSRTANSQRRTPGHTRSVLTRFYMDTAGRSE